MDLRKIIALTLMLPGLIMCGSGDKDSNIIELHENLDKLRNINNEDHAEEIKEICAIVDKLKDNDSNLHQMIMWLKDYNDPAHRKTANQETYNKIKNAMK